MIRTVVFDIGNVVWYFEEPLNAVHRQFAAIVHLSFEDYWAHYLQVYQAMERDEITLLVWLQTLSPSVTHHQVQSILDSHLSSVDFDHSVLDIISTLRQQGIKVGMLSNCENFVYPYVHQPLEKYFDFSILSWQVGIRKPDSDIYRHIFHHGSWTPDQVLFVDDKPKNIATATALGIQTILFANSSQLSRYLLTYYAART